MFMGPKQWMSAQWAGGWHVSAVVMCHERCAMLWTAITAANHKIKNVSISSSMHIGKLQPGNCVQNWTSASMCWEQWWKCWNNAKFVPDGLHKWSRRNRKKIAGKFVRMFWTNTVLKMTVSWIVSLMVARHGVIIMSRSQSNSPCSDDMWIPHYRKVQDAAFSV